MRNILLSGALGLSATVLPAASLQPLKIKTGLWQVVMTSKIGQFPAAHSNTYKSCITKEDLNNYPFTDPDANCTWKVVNSTGSSMEASGTCMPEGMGAVEFTMHLEAVDSENVRGTGQLEADGPVGTMSGIYTGTAKWIGSKCPADMK